MLPWGRLCGWAHLQCYRIEVPRDHSHCNRHEQGANRSVELRQTPHLRGIKHCPDHTIQIKKIIYGLYSFIPHCCIICIFFAFLSVIPFLVFNQLANV